MSSIRDPTCNFVCLLDVFLECCFITSMDEGIERLGDAQPSLDVMDGRIDQYAMEEAPPPG
jgi:hypothetical protein